MITQVSDLVQKSAVLIGFVVVSGVVGFVIPMLFDRDVGGALAAEIFGGAGLIFGAIIGFVVIRRRFD